MLKIALESLGCSKNLVDAEIMMGILNKKGYKLVGDFEEADIILVNTCGFIESAKQESIQTILELAQLKETANLKLLIVTGCLAQRYAEELKIEIPEIDAIVGTGSYQQIDEIIANLEKENHIVSLNDIDFAYNEDLPSSTKIAYSLFPVDLYKDKFLIRWKNDTPLLEQDNNKEETLKNISL